MTLWVFFLYAEGDNGNLTLSEKWNSSFEGESLGI